jgi:hypothetical protein
MQTSAVICVQCRRVVALGATLPAVCLGAPGLTGTSAASPESEHDCIELEVSVPDGLSAAEALAEVERQYAAEVSALGALAPHLTPQR